MIFDMPNCGGCRTCEIACSFRHIGEFIPSISSIKIIDKADNQGYEVQLLEMESDQKKACDGCRSLNEPLCVQYCEKGVELSEMVKEFILKRELTIRQ